MKDWHWIIVFAVILITPLLPNILREKCPSCKKRKLQSLDTLKILNENAEDPYSYLTFYRCDYCKEMFKRNRSKALEASSNEEFRMLNEAAIKAQHPES